jgi:nucleotide-binding universal stress UspA family protein
MYKILVAVDGSECALRALGAAIHRATQAPDVSLHLLTVRAPPDADRFIGDTRGCDLVQCPVAHSEWVLDDVERRLPINVRYDREVLDGDAAEVIARRALELRCDAIFMGARGTSNPADREVGSVAARVLDLAHPPVRLIR